MYSAYKSLINKCFAIFLPFVDYHFIFFIECFETHRASNFIEVQQFYCFLLLWGLCLRYFCENFGYKYLLLCSKNSLAISVTLKSLIHFEFLHMVTGSDPTSFFSHGYPVVQEPSVQKTLLSPLNSFGTCVKNQLTIVTWLYCQTLILSS